MSGTSWLNLGKVTDKKVFYRASGCVYGKYWGSGSGWYKAKSLNGKDLPKLITDIDNGLKTGSLDAGMGFEKLLGAIMQIVTITEITVRGKVYRNEEMEIREFADTGIKCDLTNEENVMDFAISCFEY